MAEQTLNQLFTAASYAERWEERYPPDSVVGNEFLLRAFFPAVKQWENKLAMIKGRRKAPIKLSASALDTNTLPLQRGQFEIVEEKMPYYKNFMRADETFVDAVDDALNSRNDERIKSMVNRVQDDQLNLVNCGLITGDTQLSQLLTTGAIAINDNGVKRTFDYGILPEQKVTDNWADVTTSQPMRQIKRWMQERRTASGLDVNTMVLNSTTWLAITESESVRNLLISIPESGEFLADNRFKQLFMNALKLDVFLCDDMYNNDVEDVPHIPDGVICLFHRAADNTAGRYVYAATPAEKSNAAGRTTYDIAIVETGICLLSDADNANWDIIESNLKADMYGLPSFEMADGLVIATIALPPDPLGTI